LIYTETATPTMWRFKSAEGHVDDRLLRKLDERRRPMLRVKAMSLSEGAALVLRAG
jgi:hypothetical protein